MAESDRLPIVSIEEAAEIYRVHVHTLRMWMQQGIVPSVQVAENQRRMLRRDLPDGEPLLTVEEASRELDISERDVRRLLHAKELPGLKPGRHWRIRRRDLEAHKERIRLLTESNTEKEGDTVVDTT